ncbi:MAG: HD domain-containing protein [Deltaproteobacteria bacterium]|jgi:(p)ppGpp synthase/HD superfamily hydrolase|nr:HD domain-containing protein [Deltaproteobacteria bacterium]
MSVNSSDGISETINSLKLRHKAWLFAANAHEATGQLYPGSNLSYLTHVAEVVMTLLPALEADSSLNADLAIQCAILHDTVEDTHITLEDLEKEFGIQVRQGVSALTKNKNLEKRPAMEDSIKRIKKEPKEIAVVKLADRISNLGPQLPLNYWSLDKCRRYAEEGELILQSLGEASHILSEVLADRISIWKKSTEVL